MSFRAIWGKSIFRYRYRTQQLSQNDSNYLPLLLVKCFLALAILTSHSASFSADFLSAGPLYAEFYQTLCTGYRIEAVGPLFYKEQADTRKTWAVPPVISYTTDEAVGLKEFDMLYPVLTYDRYGDQYRWQFCQVFSFAGGPHPDDPSRHRVTIFPVYFQQRSTMKPEENYTAVFPFYGHLRHRLFRDEIYFVMFPIFGESKKRLRCETLPSGKLYNH